MSAHEKHVVSSFRILCQKIAVEEFWILKVYSDVNFADINGSVHWEKK